MVVWWHVLGEDAWSALLVLGCSERGALGLVVLVACWWCEAWCCLELGWLERD